VASLPFQPLRMGIPGLSTRGSLQRETQGPLAPDQMKSSTSKPENMSAGAA